MSAPAEVSTRRNLVRHPAVAVLVAAALFGVVNVLWRFGEGAAVTLAATRAFAGLVLFAPLLVTTYRSGALGRAFRDRRAWPAMALSGVTMWSAALLFRGVPGPLAAATIGASPVVALVVGRLVGSRRIPPRAAAAVVVCAMAAFVAAGPRRLSGSEVTLAVLFLATDVASVLCAEHARRRHDAGTLTVSGLILGAAPAPLLWVQAPVAVSGLVVGVAVAGLGTLGRWLRSHALGSLSAAVVASSTQVTALVTALGGALVFADVLGPGRVVALLIACTSSFAAIVWSSPAAPDQGSRPSGRMRATGRRVAQRLSERSAPNPERRWYASTAGMFAVVVISPRCPEFRCRRLRRWRRRCSRAA